MAATQTHANRVPKMQKLQMERATMHTTLDGYVRVSTLPLQMPEKPGVYIIASTDSILYIGQSSNLKRRCYSHTKHLKNCSEVWFMEVDEYQKRCAEECRQIGRLNPKYNRSPGMIHAHQWGTAWAASTES